MRAVTALRIVSRSNILLLKTELQPQPQEKKQDVRIISTVGAHANKSY